MRNLTKKIPIGKKITIKKKFKIHEFSAIIKRMQPAPLAPPWCEVEEHGNMEQQKIIRGRGENKLD